MNPTHDEVSAVLKDVAAGMTRQEPEHLTITEAPVEVYESRSEYYRKQTEQLDRDLPREKPVLMGLHVPTRIEPEPSTEEPSHGVGVVIGILAMLALYALIVGSWLYFNRGNL